jgi:hypothetical protein
MCGPHLACMMHLSTGRGGRDGLEETIRLRAMTTVADVDRFIRIISTKGADKRRLHGSKGATVFRDPRGADRVWAIFNWDAEGWKNFVSDPEVPAILQEAGHMGKPQAAMLLGNYEA